jgi:diacylglycerol O-acyltransferase
MAQLTPVDANFLHVEGGGTVTHIGGLGILDPSRCPGGRLRREDLVELVRERAHLAKPLRQKLVEVPLGLDLPYWMDDPDFDPDLHVHEVALPRPGDALQLANEVARLHETPLDRRRPLWELYLVQGLQGGQAAIYAKVHHAAVDGVLAAETLAALLDMEPDATIAAAPERAVERAPERLAMVGTGLLRHFTYPLRSARSMARTVPHLRELPLVGQLPGMEWISRTVGTVARKDPDGLPPRPRMAAPPTPFNRPISAHRRLAYGSLPLDEVKRVSKVLGGSVNDVIMALCATALRRWLEDRGTLPDEPLIAAVPVSLRQGKGGTGNELSIMLAPLATEIADPAERFTAVRDAMRTAKRRFVSHSGTWLRDMSGLLPASIAGPTTRGLIRTARPRPLNLIVSNVPGPQFPLYVRGARVLAYYPVSVISDITGGLNITVFSYDGHVDVGVIACRDLVPDVWTVMSHLADALDELGKLADANLPEAG